MKVPLTIADHLDRAETVYGRRTVLFDEPDQPAAPWAPLTAAGMADRARAQAAALDELGVAHGERVAMVSHNSARLLTAFWGVSAYGRILVPINFRLGNEEIRYIVDHCGASMLLVDPELDDHVGNLDVTHRHVLGAESDEELYRYGVEPRPWDADEDATATVNYTSGTTARPKGVQLTHRNLWVNSVTFALHMGVSDRDVYLHTLPMFHCNGWGMTYAVTAMGGQHVALRKIDGVEILRRVDAHGVTLMCGAPAVVNIYTESVYNVPRAPRPLTGHDTSFRRWKAGHKDFRQDYERRSPGGNSTISNQYVPSVRMTLTKPSNVTGLVMKLFTPRSYVR